MTGSKWIAASLLVSAVGLVLLRPGNSIGRTAFASAIPGVDDPLTMTWTTTHYMRGTSVDGKRTWIVPGKRLNAYRHPGRYRETHLDEEGKPRIVEITDARAGRMLVLDLKEKTATLKVPEGPHDVRGPFAWIGEALRDRMVAKALRVKSVSLQGTKEVDGVRANVVRAMIDKGDDQGYARHDFLFDVDSKRLVGVWIPAENGADVESLPDRDKPVEKEFSTYFPVGYTYGEIVLDPKLDASDFSLDPPAGYAYKAIARPTITEEEMVGYLAAAARFNGDVFPDSPFAAFDGAKFNAASAKDPTVQSAAEKALIQLHDKFLMREVYQPPVRRFVDDQTEPDTFHYVGAGAKVGQADRIVGWYTLKNGSKLRALFADLSVKDAIPSELPLSLPE